MGSKSAKQLKALIIYFSATGNTEKVANTIFNALEKEKAKSTLLKVREAAKEELYEYDLAFLGSPTIQRLPAESVMDFIKKKMKLHQERGDVKLCAPRMPGKTAVVFCTYSGPHTGANEPIAAGKYMAQFFEHLGFEVAAEWYVVGEMHGSAKTSTAGKLGDIRGRPNAQDLAEVEQDVSKLVRSILTVSR